MAESDLPRRGDVFAAAIQPRQDGVLIWGTERNRFREVCKERQVRVASRWTRSRKRIQAGNRLDLEVAVAELQTVDERRWRHGAAVVREKLPRQGHLRAGRDELRKQVAFFV